MNEKFISPDPDCRFVNKVSLCDPEVMGVNPGPVSSPVSKIAVLFMKVSFWGLFKTNFYDHFRKLFLFTKFNFLNFGKKFFLTILKFTCLEFCTSNYINRALDLLILNTKSVAWNVIDFCRPNGIKSIQCPNKNPQKKPFTFLLIRGIL